MKTKGRHSRHFSNLFSSTFLAIFLLRFSPFRGALNGAPSRSAPPSKAKHSSRDVELMDLFVNCVSNAHDLGPFAVLFSTTAAASRISPSTVDKLPPGSRFDMRQVFTTSPIVVFNLSRRSDDGDGDGDGGNMLLLSALNTAMQKSIATCTVQQRSHPMINLRPDPNASSLMEILNLLLLKKPHISKQTPNEPMGRRSRAKVMQIWSWRLFPVFCCMECLCR